LVGAFDEWPPLLNLPVDRPVIGKRSLNHLEMRASTPAGKDQSASQHGAMKIVTTFSHRITVRNGIIENFHLGFPLSEIVEPDVDFIIDFWINERMLFHLQVTDICSI
jgi:hypothetical protein